MRLYDERGERKYLTPEERERFLLVSQRFDEEVRTFCATLAYSGCRISEALALTAVRVDLDDGVLIFESLKKRRRGVYRAVPVPASLLHDLARTHSLDRSQQCPDDSGDKRLWTWSRTTAWRRVRAVMTEAGLSGSSAMPKGLRHGFGIKAVASAVPLNMTQKWLGHARIATTAIYTDAVGAEERRLAARMWEDSDAA